MRLGYLTNWLTRIFEILKIVILVSSLTLAMHSAPAVADDWDDVFDTARAVLAKLPVPSRIEAGIKDAALREAVLRAYRDLKACAKVHRDQSRSTKQGTLAAFERAFTSVQIEADKSEYQGCASRCRTDAASCEKGCESARKKLCACKLTEFGCVVTQCLSVE